MIYFIYTYFISIYNLLIITRQPNKQPHSDLTAPTDLPVTYQRLPQCANILRTEMAAIIININRIEIIMVAVHRIHLEAPEAPRGLEPNRRVSSERAPVRDPCDLPHREKPVVKSVTCQTTIIKRPAKVRDSDRVRSRVSRRTIRVRVKSKSLVPFFGCSLFFTLFNTKL